MIPWLDPSAAPSFPDTNLALKEPNGLLAAGGKLTVEWLECAYLQGIFPWFSDNEPILWWSPVPRTVLSARQFRCSKSLQKLARQGRYRVTQDQDFGAVIRACAAPRADQAGTWINAEMIEAYENLHRAGLAHSLECRDQHDHLVGGLYGVSLGKVFFGESMFSRESNASKLCLKHLVENTEYELIDCQLATEHLISLGAIEIEREEFESLLQQLI